MKAVKIPKTIDCVDCAIRQSKRKPFDAAMCKAQIPPELLGQDLCGPLRSRSLSG
jgi:hypothetical protein